jgi:hypothetical protein
LHDALCYFGGLASGLLQLHLHDNPDVKDPGIYDWSF